MSLSVAVLGAGVVGYTTAIELQKEFRQAQVTVIAEKFGRDTTSFAAAGVFRPGNGVFGPNDHITRQWVADAYEYWDALRVTCDGAKAGVTQVSGYIFSNTHPNIVKNDLLEKIVPVYRTATENELKICPGNWKYGSYFTTVLTSCDYYLPWSQQKFLENGGKLIEKKIDSFLELSNTYDVIVNCTGLGAKYLCNDRKLIPIRGQVLKVEAPWIKTVFYADYDTYIIPGINSVTLGGCRQFDSYNLNVDKYDGLSIRERCENFVPSLKTAKLLELRVGLRPFRDPIRVEVEVQNINGRKIKLVHNYGHGGYGVTLAPGTSLHAVKLVKQALSGNSKL